MAGKGISKQKVREMITRLAGGDIPVRHLLPRDRKGADAAEGMGITKERAREVIENLAENDIPVRHLLPRNAVRQRQP